MTPRHAESLLDMGLYLRTKAENESAPRVSLQVPPNVGDCHRITGECHRDAGPELDFRGVLGGQHQGEKRIVVGFGWPAAVVASSFQRAHRLGRPGEVGG